MSESICKGCGSKIIWVRTIQGKRMPLDPEPVEDGNIVLMPAGAMVLDAKTAGLGADVGARRYKSHFATCPAARKFRKKKARPAGCGQGCAGKGE